MTRLAADLWVSAYMTRLRLLDIPALVVCRGDATAGAIMVKLNTLDGQAALYHRSFDLQNDQRKWNILHQGDDPSVEAAIDKQRQYDPDLWVIEVEDRMGRHMLDDMGAD